MNVKILIRKYLPNLIILLLLIGIFYAIWLIEHIFLYITSLLIPIPYSSFFIFIISHYLLIRSVIFIFIFPQSNCFFRKNSIYNEARLDSIINRKKAKLIKSNLDKIQKEISNSINFLNFQDLRGFHKNLTKQKKYFEIELKVYSRIIEKNQSSEYMNKYYTLIKTLNLKFDECDILEYLAQNINGVNNIDFNIFNRELQSRLSIISEVINQLSIFVNSFLSKGFMNFIRNYFKNDAFLSYQYMICYKSLEYQIEELKLKVDKNTIIEGILIKKKLNSCLVSSRSDLFEETGTIAEQVNVENKNNVIMICLQNNTTFEFNVFDRNPLTDFYLENDIHVFMWNYRGYGKSQGNVNFSNIRKDSEYCINFLKENLKYNKIAVHGISIGGFVACHLAGLNLVDICIADRTLSSIYDYVKFGFRYKIEKLLWLFLLGDTDNLSYYLKSNVQKIIISDPNDEVVHNNASINTCISNYFLNSQNNQDTQIFRNIEKNIKKFLIENDLALKNFQNSLTVLSEAYWNLVKKSQKHNDDLEKHRMNNNYPMPSVTYSKNEYSLNNGCNELFLFDSCGQTFVLNMNNTISIEDFLKNLIIWGSFNLKDKIILDRNKALAIVPKKIEILLNSISQVIESFEKSEKNISIIFQETIVILTKINEFLNSNSLLNHIQTSKRIELENETYIPIGSSLLDDIKEEDIAVNLDVNQHMNIGFFIPVCCGHNGDFNMKELNCLANHLENLNFICK